LGIELAPSDLSPLPSHRVDLPQDRERVWNWETRHEGPFFPDPSEVTDVRWFDADQIRELLIADVCTPHFRTQWDAWLEAHMGRAHQSAP
jgi:isopentenyldiphosphate isomerase